MVRGQRCPGMPGASRRASTGHTVVLARDCRRHPRGSAAPRPLTAQNGRVIQIERAGLRQDGVTLLHPVSLEVPRGAALVVRGPNGSGKSTLLRLLAGRTRPSSGHLSIAGARADERDPAFRRRLAAMLGLPPFARNLTLREHLALLAATWHPGGGEAARAEHALAELGLSPFAERFPHELSSGQTQLFGLALVLSRPAEVLLLDEPEQRLDSEHLAAVTRILQERSRHGCTLVVASHDDGLTAALADRTLTLPAAA